MGIFKRLDELADKAIDPVVERALDRDERADEVARKREERDRK